jgi:tRNA pseudouridine32 synthase/23S rRNA pseudouridine746 synthase
LLHVDADLVVVDKPHFLAAVPGGRFLRETALVRAKRALGNADLMPLHRLDRETAGVMMLSARPATRDAYHALLRERRVHKVYEAVAPWRDDLALPLRALHRLEDVADGPHLPVRVLPGEPNADTGVELLRRLPGGLALYRLTPRTGRRHQLRAQMNALGVPIVGDRMYPRLWPEDAPGQPPDFTQPLQLLARELVFDDPVSGAPRRFASTRRLALAGDG